MSKNTNANLDCPSIIFFLGYQPVHSTIISLQVPQRPCPAPRRTTTRRARTRTSSGRTRWTRRRSRRTRPDSASPRQLPPGQAQQRHPASHQVCLIVRKNMELEWNKKTLLTLNPCPGSSDSRAPTSPSGKRGITKSNTMSNATGRSAVGMPAHNRRSAIDPSGLKMSSSTDKTNALGGQDNLNAR